MKIRSAVVVAGAALLFGAVPMLAHHSFAAQYDATKPVEMKGVVTKIDWTNPHARFYIDVKDAKGEVTNWNFELASPNVLVRNGFKSDTLKIGDPLTVAGYMGRTGGTMAIASAVITADGQKLFASAPADLAR
jgi:hypothetical protein